ncbi:MAG: hypothetical protein WBI82_15980 [Sphaerochaeta sp.]
MRYRENALKSGDDFNDTLASEVLWETELRLRQMFDAYEGDAESEEILSHYNPNPLFSKRRNNHQIVLDNLVESNLCKAVFPSLDDSSCPSHFCFYSSDRDQAQTPISFLVYPLGRLTKRQQKRTM